MGFGSKIRINNTDHSIASSLYGTCSDSAGTAAKVVTCADFDTLITGVMIQVKFTNGNTAASPTMNVNNTGARPIYLDGLNAPGTTELKSWRANEVVPFVYDGQYWMMCADRKAVQDAITTANTNISTNTSNISTINGKIGNAALPTTAQTITGAIGEHETDISGLSTTLTNLSNTVTNLRGTSNPKMNGTVAVGTATKYSREDHVHPVDTSRAAASALTNLSNTVDGLPGTATPKMDGTAAVGTAAKFARQDHVHPSDTSREPKTIVIANASASSWTNNGSTAFPKRCAIAKSGVTTTMNAIVFFAAAQAESGNYSPYAQTYNGGVYIYSTQTTSITVPKILVFAGA